MAFEHLPFLNEISRYRRAVPKAELRSRLADKVCDARDDSKQLEAWRRAVAHRDRNRCRVCGCRTIVTLELHPKRREIHHVVSRTCKATRYDVRNGLTLCLYDHQRITRHQLFIVGNASQMFSTGRVAGKSYLNADLPLQFTEKKP